MLVLDEIGRAFQPAGRLAGDHLDRADFAFGGGAHGVEADERAGRRQDAGAFLLGAFDQVPVVEQLRDRKRHEDAAAVDGGDGDFAEQCRRQALHHDVAVFGQRGWRAQCNHVADLRQIAARFVGVAHGDGGERQAGHGVVDQPPRHFQTDRAKAGETDA